MTITLLRQCVQYSTSITLLVLLFSFMSSQSLAQANPAQKAVLEKQMAELMAWFPGRYDNALQVIWEDQLGVKEDEKNYQRHSVFRVVDLPAFGDNVIYAEQSRDFDLDNIYRQRVYVLTPDLENNAIRLRVHIPKNTEKLKGAYRNTDLLKKLKPSDTTTWDGCDLYWTREAGQFRGRIKQGECRFFSKAFNQEILLDEYLILSPDAIWFADKGTTLNGDYLFGMKGDTPTKALKVRPFECWVGVLLGAQHSDTEEREEGPDQWSFHSRLWTHDQGGEIVLNTDETPPRRVRLKLRQMHYPTENRQSSLSLLVYEGDNVRLLSEVWGEHDAERLGINLRWLQGACSYAPARVFEDGR